MKKRCKKKLVIKAIRELNNQVARDLETPEITHQDIMNTYRAMKDNKNTINSTIRDYRKYILKAI